MPRPLPIDELVPQLLDVLQTNKNVVLCAPAGAGKTTRIPPALGRCDSISGDVIVLQPRRIAARAVAQRIADEDQSEIGEWVGYEVRFDSKTTRDTRIRIVTEGVMLRKLHSDSMLDTTAAVVFDEFHERNLQSDLAFGMVKRIQETVRPDLKIIVMSATLAAQPVAEFLDNCPVLESPGRMFPVEVRYSRSRDNRPVEKQIGHAISGLVKETLGDILVFLPGVGEIRKTNREIETLSNRHNFEILELYGDLPIEKQDKVLQPCDHRRVILSTNVSETSLTVEGVTAVIDSGTAKSMRHDPGVGLDRLELVPISKASADQRRGRAGRTSPGICVRLWDQRNHKQRIEFEPAEIHRADLAATVLQLQAWGESDIDSFPWYEPPSQQSIERAIALLELLGAMENGKITDLGRDMNMLPVHPRLARILVESRQQGTAREMSLISAMLSERDPFRPKPGNPRNKKMQTWGEQRSDSDILDRYYALHEFLETGRQDHAVGSVNRGTAHYIARSADQIYHVLSSMPDCDAIVQDIDMSIRKCLLTGFPDRLAKRRSSNNPKGLMVGGKGVRLSNQSNVKTADLFLCIELDPRPGESQVRIASAIESDWLVGCLSQNAHELFFHPTNKQVVARRRRYWCDLMLSESPDPLPDENHVAKLLYEKAAVSLSSVLPDEPKLNSFRARINSLHVLVPNLPVPEIDNNSLKSVLRVLCTGRRSFSDLRSAPWLAQIKSLFSYDQMKLVDDLAPECFVTPNGQKLRLIYEKDKTPVLAARIQDLFGVRTTPTIANGTTPVLVHLLAPNMRPQQITDDLESFWRTTYSKVRGELKRRYPKHAWPEYPANRDS